MANRGAWAEIDLRAIEHNIREIRKCVRGGAKFCAVVKADAYGHGAVAVAAPLSTSSTYCFSRPSSSCGSSSRADAA